MQLGTRSSCGGMLAFRDKVLVLEMLASDERRCKFTITIILHCSHLRQPSFCRQRVEKESKERKNLLFRKKKQKKEGKKKKIGSTDCFTKVGIDTHKLPQEKKNETKKYTKKNESMLFSIITDHHIKGGDKLLMQRHLLVVSSGDKYIFVLKKQNHVSSY